MSSNSISIVIPVYNEEKRIQSTLESIVSQTKKWDGDIEIIFSNDGSTDKTLKIIEQTLSNHTVDYKIIGHLINQGKGSAIKKGILAAKNETIILFDADNATGIENFLPLQKWLKNYAIIIGSRYLKSSIITRQQSLFRRVLSRSGNLLIKLMIGLPFEDTQCGFKVLKNKAAQEIAKRMTINRWGFDIELLTIAKKLNYNIKESPVSWTNQAGSQLKAGRAAWQTFKELIKIKKNLADNLYQ